MKSAAVKLFRNAAVAHWSAGAERLPTVCGVVCCGCYVARANLGGIRKDELRAARMTLPRVVDS